VRKLNKFSLFVIIILPILAISVLGVDGVNLRVDMDPLAPGIQTSKIVNGIGQQFDVGIYIQNVDRMESFQVDMTIDRNLMNIVGNASGFFPRSYGGTFQMGSNLNLPNEVRFWGDLIAGNAPTGSGYLWYFNFTSRATGTHEFKLNDLEITTAMGDVREVPYNGTVIIKSGTSSPSFMKIKAVQGSPQSVSNSGWISIGIGILALLLIFFAYRNFGQIKRNKNNKK